MVSLSSSVALITATDEPANENRRDVNGVSRIIEAFYGVLPVY